MQKHKDIDGFMSHLRGALAEQIHPKKGHESYSGQIKSEDIDIMNTLRVFGLDASFDVSQYIDQYYSRCSISRATDHKAELHQRRIQTKEASKDFVIKNYHSLIQMSQETIKVEEDVSKLHNLLPQYSQLLSKFNRIDLKLSSENNDYEDEIEKIGDKTSNIAEKIEEIADELSSLIYERKISKAVSYTLSGYETYEQLNSNQRENSKILTAKQHLDERKEDLVERICFELLSPTIKLGYRQEQIEYLHQFGYSSRAVSIFLQNQSIWIKSEIRKIKLSGDLATYIQELSSVVFSSISSTISEFQVLFSEKHLFSRLVLWIIEEVELFGNIIKRQAFHGPESSFSTIGSFLDSAFSYSALIRKNNLSLTFLLARILTGSLMEAVSSRIERMEKQIMEKTSQETWNSSQLFVRDRRHNSSTKHRSLYLTESSQALYNVIQQFSSDLKLLFLPNIDKTMLSKLYYPISQGLIHLLTHYLSRLTSAMKSTFGNNTLDSDILRVSMLANVSYLEDDLLPRIIHKVERQFSLEIYELRVFQDKLLQLYYSLCNSFCQLRSTAIIQDILNWPNPYCSETQESNILPSNEIKATLGSFSYLLSISQKLLEDPTPLVTRCITQFFTLLSKEYMREDIKFSRIGIKQLHFDVNYIIIGIGQFLTDSIQSTSSTLLDQAFKTYSKNSPDSDFIEKLKKTKPNFPNIKILNINS